MRLISESKELLALFQKNLKWCDSLSFATAWAGPVKGLFEKLIEERKKIKLGVVGIHFYQTDPDFIQEFIDDKKVKFIMQTSGTFHPKIYYFHRDEEWRLIVGSANFTNAAFSNNSEVCVYIDNKDDDNDDMIGYKALDILCKYARQAEPFDKEKFESYKELWRRQQEKIGSLSGRYSGNGPKKHSKEPNPVFLSGCLNLSWKRFFNRVMEEDGVDHNYALRKPVLAAANEIFSEKDENNEYVCFSGYSVDNRKIIAGLPPVAYKGKKIDCGLFGSMTQARKFKHYINSEEAEIISDALDCIPREGFVEFRHYEKYANIMKDLKQVSIGIASRLLAMKRPDTFVCLDSKNAKQLCNDFKISDFTTNSTLSKEKKFELYWSEIICRIRDSVWWNAPAPLSRDEKFVWRNRVAFLDSLFYED